jgi:hypothetical protein
VPVVPAIFFPTRPDVLLPCLAGCFLAYHLFYRRVASLATSTVEEGLSDDEAAADARI